MANKRVIDLSTLSETVQEGQYILVDSSGGTGKMDLKKIVDDSTETLADQVEQNTRDIENLSGDLETLEGRVGDAEEAITGKADDDGIYPELYAGNLISDKMQTDKVPYLLRATADELGSSRIGERCYDTLIGASVGENQLINIMSVDGSKTESGITITDNRDGSYTVNGTATANVYLALSSIQVISGHKYFWSGTPKNGSSTTYRSYITGSVTGSIDYGEGVIYSASGTGAAYVVAVYINNGATVNNLVFRPQLTDLTAELGSSIADYIYSLESATAGSGIAKLRSWGFLRGYQAFNAGSIESVEVTEKKCVGFNQWDEEWEVGTIDGTTGENVVLNSYTRSKNYIKLVESASYYFKKPASVTTYLFFYDSDKNFIIRTDPFATAGQGGTFAIPSGSRYMRFATYRATYTNDICINLSNPDRNGEYEAYASQSYDYGDDTLNGIFKLDANNNLYADGDVKSADGMITRKYGIRAYQNGDESLADAFTNGIQTVYKLTTPTTEQSTPFPSPQVCYPDGTEEYLTSNGVPVGHETEYPYDLKGLVEELIDVPDVPSANGTYVLKATRSASGVAYNWVTG